MQGLAPFNRVHLPCGGPTPKPLGARAGGHSFARTFFARDKSRGETRRNKERQGETRRDKQRDFVLSARLPLRPGLPRDKGETTALAAPMLQITATPLRK